MKSDILPLLMLCTALLACSSDDDGQEQPAAPGPIILQVTQTPLQDDAQQARTDTRAAVTTTSTFNSFNLHYLYNGYFSDKSTISKSGSGWSGAPSWPSTISNNEAVAFYGYTSGTLQTPEAPALTFTCSDGQTDLLVAQNTVSYAGSTTVVPLTFDHALSALSFKIAKTATLQDYAISVTEVTLCGVNQKGTYNFSDRAWTINTSGNYTIYYGSSITVGTDSKQLPHGGEDAYFFLLPQTLTGWNKEGTPADTYIKITCSIAGGNTSFSGDAYIPFDATLQAGHIQPFTILMGTGLRDNSGNKIIQ